IVDDDPARRRRLESMLTRLGHDVVPAPDAAAALRILDGPLGAEVAAVILRLLGPGRRDLGVLKRMRERRNPRPVIVLTGREGTEPVASAMRLDAFDVVVEPAPPGRLEKTVADALKGAAEAG